MNFARRRDEFGSAVDRPIMGTCNYLAPEYLTSALRPDIRSDIYSLGAVLFEVLSGRRPFAVETLVRIVAPAPASARRPIWLGWRRTSRARSCQLVRRMMAKEPLRRPQTPRELIERLVALEIGSFSQRAGKGRRRPRSAFRLVAVVHYR